MCPKLIFFHLSPALRAMNLPILTCSYCMRKVGLWNFHQMEEIGGETETVPSSAGVSAHGTGSVLATCSDSQADSASPTPAASPCRMKLRSQDSTRSDQASSWFYLISLINFCHNEHAKNL